jgi:hypothetical protein
MFPFVLLCFHSLTPDSCHAMGPTLCAKERSGCPNGNTRSPRILKYPSDSHPDVRLGPRASLMKRLRVLL